MLTAFTCNAQSVQVLKDGKLIAEFYERDGWEFVFKEKEQDPADPYNGHEYVDLGLPSGLKWATMNVGATKPEEYGDYFAWGETEPYYTEGHSQDNPCSNWKDGKREYNPGDSYFDPGFSKYAKDIKTQLELDNDAAHVNWGGDWRMPTKEEQDELLTNCSWEWTTSDGVNGYVVTGKNGKSIFIPAAGYRAGAALYDAGVRGVFWSSSLDTGNLNSSGKYGNAHNLDFVSSRVGNYKYDPRHYGESVRPVCP